VVAVKKLTHILSRSLRTVILFGLVGLFGAAALAANSKVPSRIAGALDHHQAALTKELSEKGLELGSPIFIRAFKSGGNTEELGPLGKSARIEVWIKSRQGQYEHFRSYPICAISGKLGAKLKEGDLQVPEGVYSIRPEGMNPQSAFHISYDVGFPNAVDRARGATGSQIRVHGKCQSWGCLALGKSSDEHEIETLTVLIHYAWQNGQREIPFHIFPFPMSDQNLVENLREHARESSSLERYWTELKPVYDAFEESHVPPSINQSNGRYEVVGTPAS
jgi:murein L,D-transpeptidase YafK